MPDKNITAQDVTDWLRSAPHDQQLQTVINHGLERIADAPVDYRERFKTQMSDRVTKLFEEPVD